MNRAAILAANAANPLKTQTVHVPEWSADIVIRELSAAQARIAFRDLARLNSYLVLASVINDDGTPTFSDSDEDLATVENMPHTVIRKISDAVTELNGFGRKIEELQKNSIASQD